MCILYSYFLRYNLLERFLVIYNVSNFDHNPVTISSSITLYIISSVRHNWIVLTAFRSISSQSISDVHVGFDGLPCKVLWRSCCTSNTFTLFCHKLKFPLPLNFLTLNFVVEFSIFDISPSSTFSFDTNCYDTTAMIPIVETNNRVTTPTIVHAKDRVRNCETMTIFNIHKKKKLL